MIQEENIFWDRIAERAQETLAALKEGRSPKIIRYAVHATSFCNMRCQYCSEKRRTSKMIEKDLFIKICEKAGPKGIVHITGGEPSLIPWIQDEIYNQQNTSRFAWNSNLLLMPTDKLLESVFRIKTSLDDYRADRWNELTGGNHFDKVIQNIKRCSKAIKYTSVCFTATHENVNQFDSFIRFCQDEFPALYSISVSFYKGSGQSSLTKDDISLLFELAENLDPRSKQLFIETHSRQGSYFPQNIEIPCYLSMTEKLIDEWGDEYHCSHLFREGVRPPGHPGRDSRCVTGCNLRFTKYNQIINEQLSQGKGARSSLD